MNYFNVVDVPNGKFNKIEVKESKCVRSGISKGMGVFATKKINKGEIICWYDGIFISIKDMNVLNEIVAIVSGKNGYNQHITENECIAGFTKVFRKGGCAQLVNDYSTTTDEEEVLKNIINGKYNCRPEMTYDNEGKFKHLFFIASRSIKQGEELYYPYGAPFWKNTGDDESIEETVRKLYEYSNCIDDFKYRAFKLNSVRLQTVIITD